MERKPQSPVSKSDTLYPQPSTPSLSFEVCLVVEQRHAFAAEREQSLFAWPQQTAHALKKQSTSSPCGRELIQLLNSVLQWTHRHTLK